MMGDVNYWGGPPHNGGCELNQECLEMCMVLQFE